MKLLALLTLAIAPAFAQTVEVIPLTPQETARLKQLKASEAVAQKAVEDAYKVLSPIQGELNLAIATVKKAHGVKDGTPLIPVTTGNMSNVSTWCSSGTTTSNSLMGWPIVGIDKDFKYIVTAR